MLTFAHEQRQSRVMEAYPLNRRLGWAQGLSGTFGVKRNLLPQPETEKPFLRFPVCSLVTTLTVLSPFFHIEDQFYMAIPSPCSPSKSQNEAVTCGRNASRHITLQSRCFWDRSGTEVSEQPLTARARPPIYLRGPAIQFHKQGWRVRQDKGKVRRATYSHPH